MALLQRLVASGVVSLALAACSGPSSTTTSTSAASPAASAASNANGASGGTITIAGSTALLPLVKEAAGDYQRAHPAVKITVSGGGSATGLTQVAAGAVTIGDSDIRATEPGLEDHRVAVVAFAVAGNPANGVKSLTKEQLRDVFAGKVANWKQVGGADRKVVVVNRPRSSGTRAVFAKTIMGDAPIAESGLTEDATGTAVGVVKQTPGAVTYAALSGLGDAGLTVVGIGGVAPDDASVTAGKYPLWSYEHMYTKGPASGETARFIAYVAGAKDLVRRNKFIEISAMKVTESDR